ncbi:MAG: bifunctional 5,10-methylenetetrahydrofolate dehydrogenase/5,10-methenyltetrahydrofolate cyclohydrolase [Candidatus Pacebacteria bacterium]|nr:bifunctional 5,10-methylenetetrahydrofolate dehydrogenase/5,10-methenyltetrahydrofolate cyclohydrolase [Candidatus Paceibacterota bacterium]
MTVIVDGKKMANTLLDEMKEFLGTQEKKPLLHIIYIGSDPVIDNFVKYKIKYGESIGAQVKVHNLPSDISEQEALNFIDTQTEDADGVIVQLPLPEHLDQETLLNHVLSTKDIDVLGQTAKENFSLANNSFFPPVTGAIAYIAASHNIDFSSAETLLVGNGRLVGHPTMLWMDRESYNYTLVNKETDIYVIHQLMNDADIIISGAGQPHMIKDFFVKEGVVLFDAGTSESGKKILGDVDPDTYKKAKLATPVPGGIGPLTIAILFNNLLMATYPHYDRNIYTTT